jgi:CDP-diacylglycerol---serine O-phosphatidyltransferase
MENTKVLFHFIYTFDINLIKVDNQMKKHIPNTISLLNMLSGCIAVVYAFEDRLCISAGLIFLAALFDFLDGFFARILKVQSPAGKELDSFSDLISFGLAPAVIIFVLISKGLLAVEDRWIITDVLPFVAFLITLYSAIRLAKFNTDTRPKDRFYGLPTPANAILIGSLPLILHQNSILFGVSPEPLQTLIRSPLFLVLLTLVLSSLLISNISLISLKFYSFRWSENKVQYLFLFTSLLLLLMFFYAGIPLLIIAYFLFSYRLLR